jgi:hypothetical protein
VKLVKTAEGKQSLRITREEWEKIGNEKGWMKEAQYDYDSYEAQGARDAADAAAEALMEEGIEDPTPEQISKKIEGWDRAKDREEAKKSLKRVLEHFDYDIDKIRAALEQEERKMEALQGKEDWDAEFYPTPQGAIDAQDFKADTAQEQASIIAELERALEILSLKR